MLYRVSSINSAVADSAKSMTKSNTWDMSTEIFWTHWIYWVTKLPVSAINFVPSAAYRRILLKQLSITPLSLVTSSGDSPAAKVSLSTPLLSLL